MIWGYLWIIAIIGFVIYGLWIGDGFIEKIFTAIVLGISSFIIGAFVFYGLNALFYSPSDEYVLDEVQEVYSLKDNTYVSGHGGLISVRIEENDKYAYMIVNKDGTYSKASIESEDVKIMETNDCTTPALMKYKRPSKNPFLSIDYEEEYVFVVPTGTVVNTFSLDLE